MTELPDRLLRDALRPGAPATTSNLCVDAEALAAWADGTMSRAVRAAFEIHAADCARCQALMAAMARTEPPPIEPAWRRRALFSWLMPLAAATAAIVIVVSIAITERRLPALQIARREAAATAAPRADETAAAKAATASAPVPAAPQATASAIPDSRRERAVASAPTARRDAADLPAAKTESRAADASLNAAQPPAASPPPPRPSAAPAPPPAVPAPAATREVAAPASAAAAGTAVTADAARSKGAGTRVAQPMMKAVTAAPLLIASPDRDSQWRIVNGAVGHTDDGGKTWQEQPLGVDAPVQAGTAPAARVCWLAGARGLVLLTTDGAHWRQIAFPESVDLVAIEATDDAHATVTTATGRSYVTSDGGRTWTRR